LIDFNHPLAGQPLIVTLQIVSIENPSKNASLLILGDGFDHHPSHTASPLLRHNLVFDIFVGRARNDVLLHQLILPLIWSSLDDFLRVRIADAY